MRCLVFFLVDSRCYGLCESRDGPGIDSGFTSVCFMEGGKISELMINGQIRDREVRLISENGDQLGIMPTSRALQLAEEAALDLVKIAPKAQPPVCKIIDYGKYRYEQTRKEKEARKKQKIVDEKVNTWNDGTTAYMAFRKKKEVQIHNANSDKKDKYSGKVK